MFECFLFSFLMFFNFDYFLIGMFLQGFNEVGQRTFPPTGTHAWKVFFSNNDYWQQVLRRNIHMILIHDHLVLKSPWKCVKFQVWGDGCSCLGWRTSKNVFPQFNIISFTIVYFATTILHRIAMIITININGIIWLNVVIRPQLHFTFDRFHNSVKLRVWECIWSHQSQK